MQTKLLVSCDGACSRLADHESVDISDLRARGKFWACRHEDLPYLIDFNLPRRYVSAGTGCRAELFVARFLE